jgi:hypothetical protein
VNAIFLKTSRCYEHDWRIEDRRSQSNVQNYVEANTKRWPLKYNIQDLASKRFEKGVRKSLKDEEGR